MNGRSLWARLPHAYARRIARWLGRRPLALRNLEPIVSFTFDDFPRSALLVAGEILQQWGAGGTYFVSHGLMGKYTPTGEAFYNDDLPHLLASGHELGCHTFHHHPAWETTPSEYVSSVVHNASTLTTVVKSLALQTHSYPISYPRPATKRRLALRFLACRGGGQTFNHGTVDLNYLSSFFLEQGRDDFGAIERLIAANAKAGGWLIFSTHDVCGSPTRFGVRPEFLDQVVRSSVRSGARVLVMSRALSLVGVPSARNDSRE